MSNIAMIMGQAAAANTNFAGSWDLDYAYYSPDISWDITTMVQTNQITVASQESIPEGIFFSTDGTKMYIVGTSGDDVNEYNLSTAWNVSTASYAQNFSVATEDTIPVDIFFKSDGTKFYIIGQQGDDVNEYNLSTAWDISTASYVQNFSVATEETTPEGIFFKPDGTKMYIVGATGDEVNEYDLSTAWDISTASYLQNFSVNAQDTNPRSISFKPDGTKMFILGDTSDAIFEYSLSTAWDISTASYVQSASVVETSPYGLFFKPDGSRVYVVGTTNDTVFEYALGGFSVVNEESNPTDLHFKPDGTKMYIVGTSGDNVNEYNLSTAWDLSTASYLQNFNVALQENAPRGMFFKPDGTKMYIVGSSGDDVNEYDLSTAWDVSTASYVQNFSVATQDATPEGIFFKPDGTKMFVLGSTNDSLYEYRLGAAWNISTASYVQNFSVADIGATTPSGLFFKEDGSEFYITDGLQDKVYKYTVLNNQ